MAKNTSTISSTSHHRALDRCGSLGRLSIWLSRSLVIVGVMAFLPGQPNRPSPREPAESLAARLAGPVAARRIMGVPTSLGKSFMATNGSSPGGMLRAAVKASAIQVPGAPNALVARMIEDAGFAAMYLSGAALSAGVLALPDIGLFTLTELAQQVDYLTVAGGDSGDRRCRHRLWRHGQRRADDRRAGAGRRGGDPAGRPGAAQALRASLGQVARHDRRDVREAARGRRGPGRRQHRDHRPHRRPRRRGFRRRRRAGQALPRRRRRLDFSRSARDAATSFTRSPRRSTRRWWPT